MFTRSKIGLGVFKQERHLMHPAKIYKLIEAPFLSVPTDLRFIPIGQSRGPAEPVSMFQGVSISMMIECGNAHWSSLRRSCLI
jgi:hypothetical protein